MFAEGQAREPSAAIEPLLAAVRPLLVQAARQRQGRTSFFII